MYHICRINGNHEEGELPADLQTYRELKNSSEKERAASGRFIAEGPETLKVLLKSDTRIVSLLLKQSIYDRLSEDIRSKAERQGEEQFTVFIHASDYLHDTTSRFIAQCVYDVRL